MADETPIEHAAPISRYETALLRLAVLKECREAGLPLELHEEIAPKIYGSLLDDAMWVKGAPGPGGMIDRMARARYCL